MQRDARGMKDKKKVGERHAQNIDNASCRQSVIVSESKGPEISTRAKRKMTTKNWVMRDNPKAVTHRAASLNAPSDTQLDPSPSPMQTHFDVRAVVLGKQCTKQPVRHPDLMQHPLQPSPIDAWERRLNVQEHEAGIGARVV